MHHEIYENGQLNIEIHNIRATDDEIEKLKEVITNGIGHQNIPPVVTPEGMDQKGGRYRINFAIRGPRHFELETVQQWLYSVGLVGWNIDAKAGPKQ